MNYVDVLIPGVAGVLLVTAPRIFTKAQGEDYVKAAKKLRGIGLLLIAVAALYLVIRLSGGK